MTSVSLSTPARGLRRVRLDLATIELALVRSSVGALGAARHACRHCRRTPLVGERVYLYATAKGGEELVCELCRPLRAAAPDRSQLMRSPEQAGSVRPVARRPPHALPT
jgi:hypothetical protein